MGDCILGKKRRIIAIGDLHGDYQLTINCLKVAGVINKDFKWCGNDTIVIQIGDQVDRGGRYDTYGDENSDIKIIRFFDKLHKEAKIVGGGVYSLIGNHELMNVMGKFQYTSKSGIDKNGGEIGRKKIFEPGSNLSKILSKRFAIMKVGSWIFVHGGIIPSLANTYNIKYINNLLQEFLLGNKQLIHNKDFKKLFINSNSLLWNRTFSSRNPSSKKLFNSLKALNSDFMVVGHTPQIEGINSKCKNRIWRIDTAMSYAFGQNSHNRLQILEILNNGKNINILNV